MASKIRGVGCVGVLVLLALMAGCSSATRSRIDTVRQALRSHRAEINPTPASVAAKPYFQLQAISPDGQAILILGSVEGDLQGWYGQGGEAIFLLRGVVVRTIGLKQNLDDTLWPSGNPFAAGLHTLNSQFEGARLVDWSPGYRYGVTMHDRLVPADVEDVTILGTVHRLRRFDEQVSAPAAGFAGVNHYWVDPADGFIWKSHQVIAPGLPLDLIQLRPYREVTK
jgi:hypothetical protein